MVSSSFTPQVHYVLPPGWTVAEDFPAQLVLLPPGATKAGIDADTAEFVGVYRNVAAAAADCEEAPEPGVASTSVAMTAWYSQQPGLSVTDPAPVTVGGLPGAFIDLAVADGWTGTCPFAPGVPLVPLIVGVDPEEFLHHIINQSFSTRLYILDAQPENIVVEVVDHPDAGSLEDLTAILGTFEFATT